MRTLVYGDTLINDHGRFVALQTVTVVNGHFESNPSFRKLKPGEIPEESIPRETNSYFPWWVWITIGVLFGTLMG